LSSVPESSRFFYMFNPMVGVVEGFRNVLLKGTPPPMDALGIACISTAVLLAVAWPAFRRLSEYFADVL
jgi:lipopolysaccharide transport system permease protein